MNNSIYEIEWRELLVKRFKTVQAVHYGTKFRIETRRRKKNGELKQSSLRQVTSVLMKRMRHTAGVR